jgi:hypothetical protein
MGYIAHKMMDKAAKSFFWLNVFLAAFAAIPAGNHRSAIEAGFVMAQMLVAHSPILKR